MNTKIAAKRPYERKDILASQHVIDASLAPDASFAVYELSQIEAGAAPGQERQVSSLWRVDLAGGEPRRLTAKDASAGSPQIAPDGRSVYFLRARDASSRPQVCRLPLGGGEAETVTSLDQGVTSFALSPDGDQIAVAAFEKAPAPPAPGAHVRISRTAYRFDPAPGYLQDLAQSIHVVPAAGGEPRALTPHDGLVQAMEWSPDGHAIAAVILGKAGRSTCAMMGDLVVVGLDGESKTLSAGSLFFAHFWTADGRQVGYVGLPEGRRLDLQPRLFLIDAAGGAPVSRTAALDLAVGGSIQSGSPAATGRNRVLVSADGASALTAISRGGEVGLWEIALAGAEATRPVVSGPRVCRALARSGDLVLFSSQDFTSPCELHMVDLALGEERALTAHNADWRAEIAWPRVETVKAASAPGVEIEGWILLPPEGKKPFKTLLLIHGGPHAAWGHTFNEDFHELVGAGWAVAFANPRGSTGYGDAFSSAIVGRWGKPEFDDFNAFLDEAVKRGLSDPDRLGVSGVSGGGHLTAWLIGHTNRFKAAVPEQGVYNMFSMYGVSDAGADLITLELGGAPHERAELYWELSPIAHAHTCKTPTLLIQGENDVRCPMEQAEQLYTVLKQNGCEAELLRLAGCNHGAQIVGPPALRGVRMDALKDWFARHIS